MKTVIGVFDDKVLLYDTDTKSANYVSWSDFRSLPNSERMYYKASISKYKALTGVDIHIANRLLNGLTINTDCPVLDFNNFYVVFDSNFSLVNKTDKPTHLVFSKYSVIPDNFQMSVIKGSFKYDLTNLVDSVIYKSFRVSDFDHIIDKPERKYACYLKYNLGFASMPRFKDNRHYIESYFESALADDIYVFADISDLREQAKSKIGIAISSKADSSSYTLFKALANRLYNKALSSDILFLFGYNLHTGGTVLTRSLEMDICIKFSDYLRGY